MEEIELVDEIFWIMLHVYKYEFIGDDMPSPEYYSLMSDMYHELMMNEMID